MIELLPIETYDIILLSAGIVILLAALLPDVFEDRLITLPIFYLIFSGIVFGLLVDIDITHLAEGPYWAKRVTELAVIISLTGVGLKINKPFDKKTWSISSRLLIITMPITILLMALIGWWFLGFIPATAVLLGAVISPTDPVLAEEVQTTPPLEEDVLSTQVALTTEAGLNDGLAFPFTNMAIAIAFAGVAPAGWFMEWFLVDFLYKILIGSAVGVLLGYLIGRLVYSLPAPGIRKSNISIGIIALALTLIPYGAAEILSSYGFIAVFVAACTFRYQESEHEYLPTLHDLSEQMEQILVLLVFLLIGIYLTSGFIHDFQWYMIPTALATIFLIRPLAGILGIMDLSLPWQKKTVISFFGIRGVGSVYYLMYALYHADFHQAGEVLALVTVIIIISVIVHGLLAKPAIDWINRVKKAGNEKNQ